MSGKMKFVKSAVEVKDFPAQDRPEVAITGRSNAGKSSLINCIAGSDMARVSNTPGKTRLLNFFDLGRNYRLVDLPGYGYASRSGDEMRSWHKMIENYLNLRDNLKVVAILMDCRREWEEEEELLKQFAHQSGKGVVVVLTKADKLKQGERLKAVKTIQASSKLLDVFLVSSTENKGVKEMEDFIYDKWIKDLVVGGPA